MIGLLRCYSLDHLLQFLGFTEHGSKRVASSPRYYYVVVQLFSLLVVAPINVVEVQLHPPSTALLAAQPPCKVAAPTPQSVSTTAQGHSTHEATHRRLTISQQPAEA